MKRFTGLLLIVLLSICFIGSAIAGEVLDKVLSKKLLVVATAPNWPPQAFLNENHEMDGFDVDVSREIAKRLGVKIEFVTPALDMVVTGRWNGRWDLNVSSLTPTKKRAEVLSFPAIYYYTPVKFAVHKNSTYQSKADLNGKRIGVNYSSTQEQYLKKTLEIDAIGVPKFTFDVTPGEIKTYESETFAFDDLRLGDGVRLDAVLASQTSLTNAAKHGYPIRILDDFVLAEPLSITTDKGDVEFERKLTSIVNDMKREGTLRNLSMKWYGTDITTLQ